ncbi:DUF4192 domain-containing protein [Streptomyces tateyamensis]|uniref:DUF4192 domain-containing protein n=1 Tax=Streptomyces tateyamensis TaxID=565073 RepID=A0A2V4NML4_9ACTN|nr:DUF4192 domain-containing protein [Streptomyces tateyamensis]PYC76926.1 DUF4192 domain-containing protein [Streptomyces tateyamensis]
MTYDDATNPAPTSTGRLRGFPLLRMRGPADMAAMLPYLLGFYPDDSIVVVPLHGPALQQVGAIRLDIPEDPGDWAPLATEVARTLVELSAERAKPAEAVLIYLCRDPEPEGPSALSALRPLADQLLRAFRELDLAVKESLCVSAGRWWSFLCADPDCCPPDGVPVDSARDPRAVVAAATVAGLAPRGSRKAIAAAFAPIGPPHSERLRRALELQMARVVRDLAKPNGPARVLQANVELIAEAMAESSLGPPLLDDERAARLIVALQHRVTRDRGAEYAEPRELAAAQRLWRFLTRRCVAPYEEYAKAPLTLLAWTSWLAGDTATSRVALGRALELDPDYTLAELLYLSLNGGLPPDGLREIIRTERARRAADEAAPAGEGAAGEQVAGPEDSPDRAEPGAAAPQARAVEGADASPDVQPPRESEPGRPLPGRVGARQLPAGAADGRSDPAGQAAPSAEAPEADLIPRQRGKAGPPPGPLASGATEPEPSRPPERGAPRLPARGRFGRLARRGRHRRSSSSDRTIGA